MVVVKAGTARTWIFHLRYDAVANTIGNVSTMLSVRNGWRCTAAAPEPSNQMRSKFQELHVLARVLLLLYLVVLLITTICVVFVLVYRPWRNDFWWMPLRSYARRQGAFFFFLNGISTQQSSSCICICTLYFEV